MAGIVFGCIVPHPPLLVPAVGRGHEEAIIATTRAMESLAGDLAGSRPQTLLVISPHGASHRDAMGILAAGSSAGNMRNWGAPGPDVSFDNDIEFVSALREEARASSIPLVSIGNGGYDLDHGVMVPMHFLREDVKGVPLVPLTFSNLPLKAHFAFGQAIRRAAEKVGKRTAIIASGDLSHRLLPESPAGFDPEGRVFDERLVDAVGRLDVEAILDLDPRLIERAGECGLRPIVILLGALEGLMAHSRVLSYEGPFGVGYMVASLPVAAVSTPGGGAQKHPIVCLARDAVELFVREGKTPPVPPLAPELEGRAGVFVSIHAHGRLRGCIGTFEPARENVAREIIANAVSSATQDPRFEPIAPAELADLEYSVDVLTPPLPVDGPEGLDPKRHGVIVECGTRRGLLLPDLEGVDTVDQQILICRQKAGIMPGEPVTLHCFEVHRYR
ncbi:MAG: AmmeMemoRadiSam system protein A [Dehalococcoidia bacterium]